jgi:hypothetical protein
MSFSINSRLLATLSVMTLAGASVQAQTTVHDSFGPGNTFSPFLGWDVKGSAVPNGPVSFGAVFTPSSSGFLSDITIALSNKSGTNNAHVFLREANSLPGALSNPIIEQWVISTLPTFSGALFAPPVLTSVSNPFLDMSKSYFLYTLETGDQINYWHENITGETGTQIASTDNTQFSNFPSNSTGAYSVRVNSNAGDAGHRSVSPSAASAWLFCGRKAT